jgi:hypothetical protein
MVVTMIPLQDGYGVFRQDKKQRKRDGRRSFIGCSVVGVWLERWDMLSSRIPGESQSHDTEWRCHPTGGVGRIALMLDRSIQTWALEEARRRLEAEGVLEDPESK